MAAVVKEMYKGYFFLNYDISDPRTNEWTLMATPWPTVGILLAYLYFVLRLGPQLMANRKPFDLQKVLIVYNAFQIVSCLYIMCRTLYLTFFQYSLTCQPVEYGTDNEAMEVAGLIYFYYVIKLIDLLDTVFFVLRKRMRQVSFLHVYHHTGMVMLGWSTTKFLAGGHSVHVATLNSLVHVVMYTYYLLTVLQPSLKQSVWWKKHITQLQMVQFLMLIIFYTEIVFVPGCDYPYWACIIFVPQNFFMLVLFSDFYYREYIKKTPITQKNK